MGRPKVDNIDDAIAYMVEAFQTRFGERPDIRERLKGKDRVVQLEVTDGDTWVFEFKDGRLASHHRGSHTSPNGRLVASTADLIAVFNKELPAMQAVLTGRIKVKASLGDVFFVRSLVGW